MISIEEQHELLTAIAGRLKNRVTAYAIGGTAMMFLGFKEATADIDLVFTQEKERKEFIRAIEELGFDTIDTTILYRKKEDVPIMYRLKETRLDLFLNKVISFIFSKGMQERHIQIHEYGDKMNLLIAHPQDVIIMKCATDREKDIDDARTIIRSIDINWDTLTEEANAQVKLVKEDTLLELGYFLEKLQMTGTDVPDEVLDNIYELLGRQIDTKRLQIKSKQSAGINKQKYK
ncbi:hypothetical protein JW898_02770 [Candidatus Woesearchaeota archaeon]|nr:hypothetical protein [Candidatus Woesearchaeota archaeon]